MLMITERNFINNRCKVEKIQKYFNRMYRASMLDRDLHFQDKGISGCQTSYIMQVVWRPGLSQEDLSKSLLVNKSTVARHVSQLEKSGFIMRELDPEDQRKKRLYPSEKAKAIYEEIIDYLEDWNNLLLQDFTKKEAEVITQALQKISKIASESIRNKNSEYKLD